jgi:hypothetical protein
MENLLAIGKRVRQVVGQSSHLTTLHFSAAFSR